MEAFFFRKHETYWRRMIAFVFNPHSEDFRESKASLVYTMSFWPARATWWDGVLKRDEIYCYLSQFQGCSLTGLLLVVSLHWHLKII